ncbi:hypothetical protein [Blastococcus sp. SYSU DS0539]
MIVGTAILVSASAGSASLLLPPRYVATQDLAVVPPLISAGGVASRDASQTRLLNTDAALLASDAVLNQAGKVVGATGRELQDRLIVATNENSDLVTVSLSATSAPRAVRELGAIVETAQQAEVATERARIEAALAGVGREIETVRESEVAAQAVNLDTLETVRANLAAALASLGSSMQPVAAPSTQQLQRGPGTLVALLAGGVVGAVLGAAIVLFRARFRPRVFGADDVRALGLRVLAGPDDPVSQAARRVSNAAQIGPAESAPLALVRVDGPVSNLEQAIVSTAQQEERSLRLIHVLPSRQSADSIAAINDGPIARHTMDEDAVFSDSFRQAVEGGAGDWVLVSVMASDAVLVRACSVIGSVVFAVHEGSDARSLERLSGAVQESGAAILGVVILRERGGRRQRAHGDTGVQAERVQPGSQRA